MRLATDHISTFKAVVIARISHRRVEAELGCRRRGPERPMLHG